MDKSSEIGKLLEEIANTYFDGNKSAMARFLEKDPKSFHKYFKGERTPGLELITQLGELGVDVTKFTAVFFDRNTELLQLENEGLEKLHDRIKWIRIYYKKTISEMAGLCRVSIETQVEIEKGDKEPWDEYLDRLLNHFEDVRREWLLENKKPKLYSNSVPQNVPHNSAVRVPDEDPFAELEAQNLTPAESQILEEVKEFSEFLRTRPLRPVVKRILLQRLIESIDRAIEQLQNTSDPDDQV